MIIAVIAIAGYFGRLVVALLGPSIVRRNAHQNVSGFGLIGLSVVLFVGMIYVAGGQDRALYLLQQTIIDPVRLWVLQS